MLGALNVDAYAEFGCGCEIMGAPERMPTVPAWWPRSLPVLMFMPETTLTYSLTGMSGASSRLGVHIVPVLAGVQRSSLTPLPQKKTPRRFGMGAPCA